MSYFDTVIFSFAFLSLYIWFGGPMDDKDKDDYIVVCGFLCVSLIGAALWYITLPAAAITISRSIYKKCTK